VSPRLNLEDQFFLEVMSVAVKVGDIDKAIGNAVRFFRFAQEKHKQGKFITAEEFKDNGFSVDLFPIFAKQTPSGIQAVGSEKHFAWLEQKKQAGKSGGKASAQRQRDEKGRLLPKRTQANPNDHQASSSSSFSLSSSGSISHSRSKKVPEGSAGAAQPPVPAEKSLGAKIFDAYAQAYWARYGVEPARNATVNGQCSQLAKRLGEEAIAIVRFYVSHNRAFYVQKSHPIGLALSDAESLRTEWLTGKQVTGVEARATENKQQLVNAFGKFLKGDRDGNA
jgi:hypothetical protein